MLDALKQYVIVKIRRRNVFSMMTNEFIANENNFDKLCEDGVFKKRDIFLFNVVYKHDAEYRNMISNIKDYNFMLTFLEEVESDEYRKNRNQYIRHYKMKTENETIALRKYILSGRVR